MWKFLESNPVVPITVVNTLASESRPVERSVLAVVDTGYSGFLLVPERMFRELGFADLKKDSSRAQLANGSIVELSSSYGTVRFRDLETEADGRVQTCEGAEEVLIGMDGLRGLAITVDGCKKTCYARTCRS
jgi:clan AA aspartic protease